MPQIPAFAKTRFSVHNHRQLDPNISILNFLNRSPCRLPREAQWWKNHKNTKNKKISHLGLFLYGLAKSYIEVITCKRSSILVWFGRDACSNILEKCCGAHRENIETLSTDYKCKQPVVEAWPEQSTFLCKELRPRQTCLGVHPWDRTRDLLHGRRALYAKSHSNGDINCHSELVFSQLVQPTT